MRVLLRTAALLATAAALSIPCSVKDVANGLRDGLQASLRARQSRLTVELPPGAPLALRGGEDDGFQWFKGQETETAKVIKGDRALADFVSLLFPDDFAVASVYTSPEAAQAAADSGRSTARGAVAALPEDGVAVAMGGGAKKRKKSRAKPKTAASGFGAAPAAASTAPKKLWCPALGLEKQADVVLVVGRLDGAAAAAVDAVADELGDEVAMILCSTRVEHACHVEAGSRHRRGVARG